MFRDHSIIMENLQHSAVHVVPFILNLRRQFKEIEGLNIPNVSKEILWCMAWALGLSDKVKVLNLTGALYTEISENAAIQTARYEAIADALVHNKSIQRLILDKCDFSLAGAKIMAEALRMSTIETISLEDSLFEGNAKELMLDALAIKKLDQYTSQQIDQLAAEILKQTSGAEEPLVSNPLVTTSVNLAGVIPTPTESAAVSPTAAASSEAKSVSKGQNVSLESGLTQAKIQKPETEKGQDKLSKEQQKLVSIPTTSVAKNRNAKFSKTMTAGEMKMKQSKEQKKKEIFAFGSRVARF